MSPVSTGPAPRKRTRRQKVANEARLLRRDGPRKYVRSLRAVRRFNRAVVRL